MKKKLLSLCSLTILALLVLTVGCSKQSNLFKSNKLGFSLAFPDSWKDKYRIEENDMGITVYFETVEKTKDGSGMLFTFINKASDNLNEDHFDTIGDIRYFKVKDVTYVIGGPMDVSFPWDHAEFKTFLKMNEERKEVINTLEILER